jgi:hypothetical protein
VDEDAAGGGASRSTDPASGSSSATDVSIREFLEDRIDSRARYLHGEIDGHSKQDRLITVAIGILGLFAWKQLQEHLALLNHENQRISDVVTSTVSADTYLSDESRRTDERTKLDDWRGGVDRKLNEAATKEEVKADVRMTQRGVIDSGTRLVQVAVVIIALVISYLGYRAATHSVTVTPPPTIVTVTTAP